MAGEKEAVRGSLPTKNGVSTPVEQPHQPQKKRRGRQTKSKVDSSTCHDSSLGEVQSLSSSQAVRPSCSGEVDAFFGSSSHLTPSALNSCPLASSSPLEPASVEARPAGGRAPDNPSPWQAQTVDTAPVRVSSVRSDQATEGACASSFSSLPSSVSSVTSLRASSISPRARPSVEASSEQRDRQQDLSCSPGKQFVHRSPRSSDGTLPDSGHLLRLPSPVIVGLCNDSQPVRASAARNQRTRGPRETCAPPDLAAVLASVGARAEHKQVANRLRESRKPVGEMVDKERREAVTRGLRNEVVTGEADFPLFGRERPSQQGNELPAAVGGGAGDPRPERQRGAVKGAGDCADPRYFSPEGPQATVKETTSVNRLPLRDETRCAQTEEARPCPSEPLPLSSPGMASSYPSLTASSSSSASASLVVAAPASSGHAVETPSLVSLRPASPSFSRQSSSPDPAGGTAGLATGTLPCAPSVSPPSASASPVLSCLTEEPSHPCTSPPACAPASAPYGSSQESPAMDSPPQPDSLHAASSDEKRSCPSVSSATPWSPLSPPQSSSPPHGPYDAVAPLSPPPDVILSPVSPSPFRLGDVAEFKPSTRGGRTTERASRRVEHYPGNLSNSQQQQQALFFPPPPSPFGGNSAVLRLGIWLAERPGLDDEHFTSLFESFLLHFDFIHAATQSTSFLQHAQLRRDLLLPEEEEDMPLSAQKLEKRQSGQQSGPVGNAGQNQPSQRDQAEEFEGILLDILSLRGGRGVHTAVEALVAQLKEKSRQPQQDVSGQGTTGHTEGAVSQSGLRLGERFYFPDKAALKSRLRQVLQAYDEKEDLRGDDFELVKCVLAFHPRAKRKMHNLSGIFVGAHPNPKFHSTRCFFIRRLLPANAAAPYSIISRTKADDGEEKKGVEEKPLQRREDCEDFSYVRCVDNMLGDDSKADRLLCHIIKQVTEAFPSCVTHLHETIRRNFPPLRLPVDVLVSYVKNILWISHHVLQVRPVLWKLLLSKMTSIDVEIKLADPNSIDLEQMQVWKKEQLALLAAQLERGAVAPSVVQGILGEPQWFQLMYEKVRGEEDIDVMATKLDGFMRVIFAFLQLHLPQMATRPAAPGAYRDVAEESEASQPSSVATYSPCVDDDVEPLDRKENKASADETTVPQGGCGAKISHARPNPPRAGSSGITSPCCPLSPVSPDSALSPDLHCAIAPVAPVSPTRPSWQDARPTTADLGLSRALPVQETESVSPRSKQTKGDEKLQALLGERGGDKRKGAPEQHAMTEADVFVYELLDIFMEVVLPVHRCKYVQFLVFYLANLRVQWAGRLMKLLFKLLFDKQQHMLLRRIAAKYISSFLCRALNVPPRFIRLALQHLFQLLHQGFLLTGSPGAARQQERLLHLLKAQHQTVYNSESPLALFFTVCQSCFYVLCYHLDALAVWPSGLDFLHSKHASLHALLSSPLRPLMRVKRGIAREFVAACRRVGGFEDLESHFKEVQARGQASLPENQDHGESLGQVNSGSPGEATAENDEAEAKGSSAQSAMARGPRTEEKGLEQADEDEGGASEADNHTEALNDVLWLFDPLDAFFPFDPYPLRHSHRFIANKYREWSAVVDFVLLREKEKSRTPREQSGFKRKAEKRELEGVSEVPKQETGSTQDEKLGQDAASATTQNPVGSERAPSHEIESGDGEKKLEESKDQVTETEKEEHTGREELAGASKLESEEAIVDEGQEKGTTLSDGGAGQEEEEPTIAVSDKQLSTPARRVDQPGLPLGGDQSVVSSEGDDVAERTEPNVAEGGRPAPEAILTQQAQHILKRHEPLSDSEMGAMQQLVQETLGFASVSRELEAGARQRPGRTCPSSASALPPSSSGVQPKETSSEGRVSSLHRDPVVNRKATASEGGTGQRVSRGRYNFMNARAFREDEEKCAERNSEEEEMCGPSEEEDLSSFCGSTSGGDWTGEDEKGERAADSGEVKVEGVSENTTDFPSSKKRKRKRAKWSGGPFLPCPRLRPLVHDDGDAFFDSSPSASGLGATDEVVSFLAPRVAASIADQLEPEIDAVGDEALSQSDLRLLRQRPCLSRACILDIFLSSQAYKPAPLSPVASPLPSPRIVVKDSAPRSPGQEKGEIPSSPPTLSVAPAPPSQLSSLVLPPSAGVSSSELDRTGRYGDPTTKSPRSRLAPSPCDSFVGSRAPRRTADRAGLQFQRLSALGSGVSPFSPVPVPCPSPGLLPADTTRAARGMAKEKSLEIQVAIGATGTRTKEDTRADEQEGREKTEKCRDGFRVDVAGLREKKGRKSVGIVCCGEFDEIAKERPSQPHSTAGPTSVRAKLTRRHTTDFPALSPDSPHNFLQRRSVAETTAAARCGNEDETTSLVPLSPGSEFVHALGQRQDTPRDGKSDKSMEGRTNDQASAKATFPERTYEAGSQAADGVVPRQTKRGVSAAGSPDESRKAEEAREASVKMCGLGYTQEDGRVRGCALESEKVAHELGTCDGQQVKKKEKKKKKRHRSEETLLDAEEPARQDDDFERETSAYACSDGERTKDCSWKQLKHPRVDGPKEPAKSQLEGKATGDTAGVGDLSDGGRDCKPKKPEKFPNKHEDVRCRMSELDKEVMEEEREHGENQETLANCESGSDGSEYRKRKKERKKKRKKADDLESTSTDSREDRLSLSSDTAVLGKGGGVSLLETGSLAASSAPATDMPLCETAEERKVKKKKMRSREKLASVVGGVSEGLSDDPGRRGESSAVGCATIKPAEEGSGGKSSLPDFNPSSELDRVMQLLREREESLRKQQEDMQRTQQALLQLLLREEKKRAKKKMKKEKRRKAEETRGISSQEEEEERECTPHERRVRQADEITKLVGLHAEAHASFQSQETAENVGESVPRSSAHKDERRPSFQYEGENKKKQKRTEGLLVPGGEEDSGPSIPHFPSSVGATTGTFSGSKGRGPEDKHGQAAARSRANTLCREEVHPDEPTPGRVDPAGRTENRESQGAAGRKDSEADQEGGRRKKKRAVILDEQSEAEQCDAVQEAQPRCSRRQSSSRREDTADNHPAESAEVDNLSAKDGELMKIKEKDRSSPGGIHKQSHASLQTHTDLSIEDREESQAAGTFFLHERKQKKKKTKRDLVESLKHAEESLDEGSERGFVGGKSRAREPIDMDGGDTSPCGIKRTAKRERLSSGGLHEDQSQASRGEPTSASTEKDAVEPLPSRQSATEQRMGMNAVEARCYSEQNVCAEVMEQVRNSKAKKKKHKREKERKLRQEEDVDGSTYGGASTLGPLEEEVTKEHNDVNAELERKGGREVLTFGSLREGEQEVLGSEVKVKKKKRRDRITSDNEGEAPKGGWVLPMGAAPAAEQESEQGCSQLAVGVASARSSARLQESTSEPEGEEKKERRKKKRLPSLRELSEETVQAVGDTGTEENERSIARDPLEESEKRSAKRRKEPASEEANRVPETSERDEKDTAHESDTTAVVEITREEEWRTIRATEDEEIMQPPKKKKKKKKNAKHTGEGEEGEGHTHEKTDGCGFDPDEEARTCKTAEPYSGSAAATLDFAEPRVRQSFLVDGQKDWQESDVSAPAKQKKKRESAGGEEAALSWVSNKQHRGGQLLGLTQDTYNCTVERVESEREKQAPRGKGTAHRESETEHWIKGGRKEARRLGSTQERGITAFAREETATPRGPGARGSRVNKWRAQRRPNFGEGKMEKAFKIGFAERERARRILNEGDMASTRTRNFNNAKNLGALEQDGGPHPYTEKKRKRNRKRTFRESVGAWN